MTGKTTPHDLRAKYAARLRELRLTKGLSQQKLAEMMGVHRSYPAQVELGLVNISLDNLEKFFNILMPELNDGMRLRERVGSAIRRARGDKISQENLSLKAEIAIISVGRIERGAASTSIDRIGLLAEALGVSGEELLEGRVPHL